MRALPTKLKPTSGFSHIFHLALTVSLPVILFVLIRISFNQIALGVILFSKWRMFAVRPRYWPANIRANAVDLFVGLSAVVFMTHASSTKVQLIWALLYTVWLLFIKPGSDTWLIWLQAGISQGLAMVAVSLAWDDAPLVVLVLAMWAICYLSARHFLSAFDEPHTSLYAHIWGYFAAALTWVLGHWLLFYGYLSQPMLLLSVLGLGFSALYYLEETDRLSLLLRRQFIFIMIAVIVVVLVFSDWGDKAI